MSVRLSAVRLSSLMVEVAAPPIRTSPASGRSNSPARCRSVDFPAPDGAMSATDWPGASSSEAPFRTSTVVSPRPYRRSTLSSVSAATRAWSFIAQRLDRIELGRAPGRIDRRRERQDQRNRDDGENVRHFDARGQLRQEIELRGKEIGAGDPAQTLADRLDIVSDKQAKREADARADEPDGRAGDKKDAHDRAARCAHPAPHSEALAFVL